MNKATINGKEIEYGDATHTSVCTSFGFKDRIRILFGKRLHQCVSIYFKEDVLTPIVSDTTASVEALFPRKYTGLVWSDKSESNGNR